MSESIPPETIIGQYSVLSKIGEGGMGEVYRARDTKLGRDVAIKVLPAAFSADAERLRRFEQEAQAAGALNHPNILVIFHVGTHDGAPYIVSELLEGETLRERMAGAALPQRKAMDYGLQIAHGLAAAHAKGIVHRDLKPENLFITNDGRVKILDFGLAKLTGAGDGTESQTEVPTRKVNTDPGTVMGTMGYMSPEQLKGRPADHRSDIFSFGAILYEMLSGKRAFRGESMAETMSAILREDPPDLSETNKTVSPALERVVHHCLEKNPEERFHSASDLAFAIEALSGSTATSAQTLAMETFAPRWMKPRELIGWSVAAVAIIVAIAFGVSHFRRAPTEAHAVRLFINPPEKASFGSVAISPDGLRLAFVSTDSSGKTLLWIRPLDSLNAQPLSGTEDALYPFWSPDSRFIGFFASGKLKKIEVTGGPPQALCNAALPRGGTWNRDGVIIFAPAVSDPLYRVSAAGGEPSPLTTLDRSRLQTSHRWPYFLPDGRHFLYFVISGQQERRGIYVGSLDAKDTRLVLSGASPAAYAPPGYLLFQREGTLMAQGFDADKLQLTGDPFPIAEHAGYDAATYETLSSVSATGVLAYNTGGSGKTQLTWVERNGKEISLVGQPVNYLRPWLSPDEKRVAVEDIATSNRDIWIIDLSRGSTPSRFTFDPATDWYAVWSPDGSRILFASTREGGSNLYQKPASGAGNEELLLKSDKSKNPSDWSQDGRFILYTELEAKTRGDVWVLPLFGDRKPFPFVQTEADERYGHFSPDGRWIAYASDESGTWQIYVQSFPAAGGKWQVSTNGGNVPRWRRDGKELFYVSADKKLMAVDVKGDSSTFEAGVPRALFDVRVPSLTDARSQFAVTGDGQRFLVNNLIEVATSSPITVVLNWTADLKR